MKYYSVAILLLILFLKNCWTFFFTKYNNDNVYSYSVINYKIGRKRCTRL